MSRQIQLCPQNHKLHGIGYRVGKGTRILIKGFWYCSECNKFFKLETKPRMVELTI